MELLKPERFGPQMLEDTTKFKVTVKTIISPVKWLWCVTIDLKIYNSELFRFK